MKGRVVLDQSKPETRLVGVWHFCLILFCGLVGQGRSENGLREVLGRDRSSKEKRATRQ